MALFHLLPILFILLSTSSFITAEITCASDETLPPLSQFTDLNNTITEALGWANTDAAIPPYGTPDAWITIPVYYHNLKFNCPCPGNIGDDIIRRHHNFLNDAFRSLYIRFDLRAIVWHNNQDLWFQRALNDNNIAGDMYSRTRRGDYKTLNVYYVGGPGNPKDGVVVVGKGTFPRVAPNAAERKVDGVMVRWETSPGLNIYGWDLVWKGKTAIHEIGHWLGLRHPFADNGDCNVDGDGFSDTPRQSKPSYSCDYNKDTCPNHPEKDDPQNYMDYSPDDCRIYFTDQQVAWMYNTWHFQRLLQA